MNSSELARQGDPHAIADLINRNLQPKGIAAKTSIKESCLKILLEAEDVPDQKILANYIYQGVKRLEIQSIQRLVVFGRKVGGRLPNWTQQFELKSPQAGQALKDLQTLTAVQPTVGKPEKKSTARKIGETLCLVWLGLMVLSPLIRWLIVSPCDRAKQDLSSLQQKRANWVREGNLNMLQATYEDLQNAQNESSRSCQP